MGLFPPDSSAVFSLLFCRSFLLPLPFPATSLSPRTHFPATHPSCISPRTTATRTTTAPPANEAISAHAYVRVCICVLQIQVEPESINIYEEVLVTPNPSQQQIPRDSSLPHHTFLPCPPFSASWLDFLLFLVKKRATRFWPKVVERGQCSSQQK